MPLLVFLISQLALHFGARPLLARQGRAERRQFVQNLRDWTLRRCDGPKIRNRSAVAGDDDLFTGFDLVQELTQVCFRVGQIDREHQLHP